MKRFRWTAALVALVLMLSWGAAAQAQTATDDSTTPTVDAPKAPESPPSGDQEKLCDPGEGVTAHSKISVDTASAHPSASASFTVKEGCRVVVFLVSVDEAGNPLDSDPPLESQDPTSGPGEHTLTVSLRACKDFFVLFGGFKLPQGQPPAPQELRATAKAMSNDQPPPEPEFVLFDDATGKTTNCPTTTTAPAHENVPTTTQGGALPFTGSNTLPLLVTALVLMVGGGAALFATRIRGRHAK